MTREQATAAFMRGSEHLTPHQAKGCIASSQTEYKAFSNSVKVIKEAFISGDYNRDMAISALVGKMGYGRQGAAIVVNKWDENRS